MRKKADLMLEEIRTLAVDPDPGGALQRICDLMRDEVEHYNWVGYYIAVPEDRLLALGPFSGKPTEHLKIPYGRGICGQAAETQETFVVPDVMSQSNYLSCSIETKAEIVVPVFWRDSFVGELDIDSHTVDPFTKWDDTFLNEVVLVTAPLVAAILGPAEGYLS